MALITRIVLRNDSTANWQANGSAVLSKGEIGFEFLDSGQPKMKVGNGVSTWNELPYFNSNNIIDAINEDTFIYENDKLTLLGFEQAESGSTPVKSSDGKLAWEKLEAADLKSEIQSLADIVNQLDPRAQENVIEQICLANTGKSLAVIDKTVQIPFATSNLPGLVKLSKEISFDEDQSLMIRQVNVNKLVQTAGEEIHLICGNANV